MAVGDFLRVSMVVAGILLLLTTISSLAKRKMTETVCLVWGLVSIVFILAGILLRPYGISRYISMTGLLLITIIGLVVLYSALFISTKLSELARKNHELAVQVSLLNHENSELIKRVEWLEEKYREEKQVE